MVGYGTAQADSDRKHLQCDYDCSYTVLGVFYQKNVLFDTFLLEEININVFKVSTSLVSL